MSLFRQSKITRTNRRLRYFAAFKAMVMRSLSFLILLTGLISCGPAVSYYYDFDRSQDLTRYRSFDWKMDLASESKVNPLYYNELSDKRIRTAVNDALLKKGYVNRQNDPDLFIHYHITIEDKTVAALDPSGHNYNAYWLGTELSTYQYKEGTLIIDLMDRQSNTLIWRGWAVAVLEDVRPENLEKKIRITVDRIFEKLPDASRK